MTTAPNLVVAGHPGLSQKLRTTGRFPAVFDVASATELRNLSESGEVRSPATFMFAPDFVEDLPDAGVPHLANGLAASGFTVLVHSFFTERGDHFGPGVVATSEPMSMSDLLTTLSAVPQESLEQQDLQPEPPPEPWAPPGAAPAEPTEAAPAEPTLAAPAEPAPATPGEPALATPGEPGGRPPAQPPVSDEPPPGPVQTTGIGAEQELPETPPEYGELSIVHRGAGAVTYRAVHEESGIVVALRVRHEGVETPPDELAALERASRSDHIVTVLECGRTPAGRAYTASVHYPAGAYAPGPPLPIQDAVGIAESAGKGLQALHEEGLVHGDVHPGRILRGAEVPLLTGAATLRGLAVHSAPGVLGPVNPDHVDPGFAAPEVLLLQPATAASDVYGLGATLWSLLAGHAPFIADDRQAVRERALNGAVPPVPRSDVPEWLAKVLAQAMAREPADRYPTARAFTEALEEGLRGQAPPERLGGDVPAPAIDVEVLPPWSWEETAPEPDDPVPDQVPDGPVPDPVGSPVPFPVLAPASAPVTSGHRGRHRKPVLAALVMFVLVGTGIGAAALMGGDGAAERRPQARSSPPGPSPAKSSRTQAPQAQPPQAQPSGGPTSTPTAVRPVRQYTPGRVRIVDSRVSIKVTWVDRSGGRAAYYVVGGPMGRPPSTLASAPPGTEKVMIVALNPSVDYCLTVVAVVDVDGVGQSKPVCTHRV